jgi:PhnB protein
MLTTNTYLNFDGDTLPAFEFYRSIFGGEFDRLLKMGEMPSQEKLSEQERNLIAHVGLKLSETATLHGSDIVKSYGHQLTVGNNFYILLSPDSRTEADQLFAALSAGGTVEIEMTEMFWGAYYGAFKDKFGIQWMISFEQ